MKNTFRFLLSRTGFLIAGVALSLTVGVAFAAWTPPAQKSSLDPLYASDWNNLLTHVGAWEKSSENVLLNTSGSVGIGGDPETGIKLDVFGKIKGQELCIGSDCRTGWPSAPGWVLSSGSISTDSSFTGKVTIGSSETTGEKLDVVGKISAAEDICTDLNGGTCLSTVGGGWDLSGGNLSTDSSFTGKMIIGSVGMTGDRLDVMGNINASGVRATDGYIQLDVVSGSTPPPADDCALTSHLGRMKVDDSTTNLYVCTSDGNGGYVWTVK